MVNKKNDANKEKESATSKKKSGLQIIERKIKILLSQNKIALDFLAKFKKTVDRTCSRTCVTKILQKRDQLLAYSKADPEIESKRIKQMTTITKVGVAPLTFVLVYPSTF